MKVVAILQNQYFNNPEKMRRMFEANPERREWLIGATLFMGCTTGKRLYTVFGRQWRLDIVWEEASREIGGKSNSCFPADPEHIKAVLAKHKPDVVLAFGKIACDAMKGLSAHVPKRCKLITGPHPAARHATVMEELREVRRLLDVEVRKRKVVKLT